MRTIYGPKRDKIIFTILPIFIAVTLSWIFCFVLGKNCDVGEIDFMSIVSLMISVWATLLGFVITAVSILIAFEGSEHTKVIKDSGHYSTIIYLYILTGLIMLTAMSFFICIYFVKVWNELIMFLLITFIIATFVLLFFCIVILFLILKTAVK